MNAANDLDVSFSHVQLYVDHLEDVSVYQQIQGQLDVFHKQIETQQCSIEDKKPKWQDMVGETTSPLPFVSHGRDIVKQFLAGLGFRITRTGPRRLLVTSSDPNGVQFIVAARNEESDSNSSIFSSDKYDRFMHAHHGHLGISVLGFAVNDIATVLARYQEKHPILIDSYHELAPDVKILEVFAYYSDSNKQQSDPGTILRFVETSSSDAFYKATGLEQVPAEFNNTSYPAYSDHWVSNVHSRTDFLDTLNDTLGFTPKVDFNAGVVAAGEAQIESTVTGNSSSFQTSDPATALRDQSQVFLPINNALSSVGHVHGFLHQLGQGIQHVASRVENLVDFVQQANDNRKLFGEGFSFLNIPRSYYGVLMQHDLEMENIDSTLARAILNALRDANIVAKDGAVDLEVDRKQITAVLESCYNEVNSANAPAKTRESLVDRICLSRYRNLYSLLGSHVSEATYLSIVRNQILVDIQGEDLLYQIFTANILQRKANDEAPFLEFIQRVCSECVDESGCPATIKPGCGGFVSKAMRAVSDAQAVSDAEAESYHQAVVDCFTSQLNESDPILTVISNAMTEEGYCKEKIKALISQENRDETEIIKWQKKEAEAEERKNAGNLSLMECSARYNERMKALRQARCNSC